MFKEGRDVFFSFFFSLIYTEVPIKETESHWDCLPVCKWSRWCLRLSLAFHSWKSRSKHCLTCAHVIISLWAAEESCTLGCVWPLGDVWAAGASVLTLVSCHLGTTSHPAYLPGLLGRSNKREGFVKPKWDVKFERLLTHTYTHTCAQTHMWVFKCVCMSIYVCIYMHIYTYIFICVCYICEYYTCILHYDMCVCVYPIYTHILTIYIYVL